MRDVKKIMSRIVAVIVLILTLTSCYHATVRHHDAYVAKPSATYADNQMTDTDSTTYDNMSAFYQSHHYAQN